MFNIKKILLYIPILFLPLLNNLKQYIMGEFKLSFSEFGTKSVSFIYETKTLDSAYDRAIKHLKQTNDNQCLIKPKGSKFIFRVRKSDEKHTNEKLNGFSFDGQNDLY